MFTLALKMLSVMNAATGGNDLLLRRTPVLHRRCFFTITSQFPAHEQLLSHFFFIINILFSYFFFFWRLRSGNNKQS